MVLDRQFWLAVFYGASVALLVRSDLPYAELIILLLSLAVFGRSAYLLTMRVLSDAKVWKLERDLEWSLHVDCDARTAYTLLKDWGHRETSKQHPETQPRRAHSPKGQPAESFDPQEIGDAQTSVPWNVDLGV